MTITRNDVIDILSTCAAGDQRKVGESDVRFWLTTLRPDLTPELCFEAVRQHYRFSTDRAMPGHINNLAVMIRRDRAEREKGDEIHLKAITPPNPALGGLPIPTDGEPVWAAYDEGRGGKAIDRHCPRCQADPGEACCNPKTGHVTKIPCLVRLTGKQEIVELP